MAAEKVNFTDNRLRKLTHGGTSKRQILFDKTQPGLALQITPAGTKTFQFRHWDRNRRQTKVLTIGKYPTVSINEARAIAADHLVAMNKGIDVVETVRALREESTFDEMFQAWLEQHAKPHKKSWQEDERRYKLYMEKPFGKKKLSWFTPARIRKWHRDITKLKKQRGQKGETVSPATANRALALVSVIFNQMRPEHPNPCKGIKKFREQSRDRFLQPEELKRFFEALDDPTTPQMLRDYLLVSIFTGARRSNVLAMKWKDIDLKQSVWRIPADQSKNGEPMTVPLVPQAVDILARRKSETSSIFVFSSQKSRSGHLEEPKTAWRSLLKRAGLKNVRLHDLRRTLGSWQTITGASTAIVGKTLGHKTPQATAVYARLHLDPVRASMENAVNAMLAAREMPDKVVGIKTHGE
ncbi:tyrosine-type recombinase/integrase [Desulfolithobacter sp.]